MQPMENRKPLVVRYLGTQDYSDIFAKMKDFNEQRDKTTEDEIWMLEHHPVFTQGQAGKEEYILYPAIFRWLKVIAAAMSPIMGPVR